MKSGENMMYLGKSYPGSDGQAKGLSWLIRLMSGSHQSQKLGEKAVW